MQAVDTTYTSDAFDDFEPKTQLELMVEDLNEINLQIAHLQTLKEKVTWKIIDELKLAQYHVDEGKRVITDVKHEGSQTLTIGKFKVTASTLVDWKIDIDEYLVAAPRLSDEFNPVKAQITYKVNNKKLTDLNKYGSENDKKIAQSFLVKRFANPSLKLSFNV